MPLAPDLALAPNFTAGELGADDPTADATIIANLQKVALWLQSARDVLGVPLKITSGYRSPEHNASVGGSSTSDHPHGLAADFLASGLTPYQVYTSLKDAEARGMLPRFDQLIYYEQDDHVHVGLGAQMREDVSLATTEGSYVALAGELVTKLRGYV